MNCTFNITIPQEKYVLKNVGNMLDNVCDLYSTKMKIPTPYLLCICCSFMGFAVGKQLQKTSAEEALATHQLAFAGQHALKETRASHPGFCFS